MLVTGGAGGIGSAVVERCLHDRARVAVLDLAPSGRPDRPRTASYVVDGTDSDAVDRAVTAVERRWGPVTGLVNKAGLGAHGEAVDCPDDTWDRVLDIDLRGAWYCARRVLPGMRAAGSGSIVNVTSIHGRLTAPGYFPYPVGKAGLAGMTRSMAVDEGPRGVRVNGVAPGWTATRLVEEQFAKAVDPLAERRRVEHAHPLRRVPWRGRGRRGVPAVGRRERRERRLLVGGRRPVRPVRCLTGRCVGGGLRTHRSQPWSTNPGTSARRSIATRARCGTVDAARSSSTRRLMPATRRGICGRGIRWS